MSPLGARVPEQCPFLESPAETGTMVSLPVKAGLKRTGALAIALALMDFRDLLGVTTSVTVQCPLMLSLGPSRVWTWELSKYDTQNPSMTQH